MKHRLMTASCLLLLTLRAGAQQPAAPPVAATRLQQMEGIYQKELSARHIPLLGKYLVELQRLLLRSCNIGDNSHEEKIHVHHL